MRKLLLLLCAAAPAFGDPLTDLRTTLAGLHATTPVRGSFDVTTTSKSDEDEPTEMGKAIVGFEANGDGLRVLYSKSALATANAESRANNIDPEKQSPTRTALNQFRSLHLAELVDAAASLAVSLEEAQFVSQKQVSFRGRPTRLITLKITPKFSKREKKHMKKFDMTMSVWVGDDGVPLAAERTTSWKASILLLSIERDEKQSWQYTRAADRLVTTRFEERAKSKGLGQNRDSSVTEVLTLQ